MGRLGPGPSDVAWATGTLVVGLWNLWFAWDAFFAGYEPHLAIDTVSVLVASTALLFRRRLPLTVLVVTGLVLFVADLFVPTGPVLFGEWLPFLVACYSAAASDTVRRAVVLPIAMISATAAFAVMSWRYPVEFWHVAPAAVWFGEALLAVGLGFAIARHRLISRELTEHAAELKRYRRRDAEQAVQQERARIARELHDVIAHHVTVMVVQASAAQNVLRASPDAATSALLNVQASGREALEEMKLLLGVLRDDGDGDGRDPMPGLARLEELVCSMRDAGLDVELVGKGLDNRLPPSVDVAAFRIVQEALTNAMRYAPRGHVRVGVDVGASTVRILVHDDGPGRAIAVGSGHGLDGLRERVSLLGGTLDAGPAPEGGFTLRADLPPTGAMR